MINISHPGGAGRWSAAGKAFYSGNSAKVLFDFQAVFDKVSLYLNREIGIPWQKKIKAI
jgi:hypothetical protein